ncbi:SusD-like starch-binding protein associating with outer membrane [Chitinophaga dinghuensis]|uniref:SusD-like starch-binding protein associating with outer membrane n=1 Tax=Chitinophaga dinghuensis TaxID=1539050 RepID=A0A327VY94_9BACT|nr:SusD/RagB family nutrient-binding outer membrane lipoprotein [Chitinophaga dinghuensis]RAJ76732.1 SusD-like starch-binding protein associating with outer membrane [Chitinophaga dinghuensis]
MQLFAKYKYIFLLGASMGLASCDKGFENLNTNPNASTTPNVNYLFSQSLLKGNLVYDRAYYYTSYLHCGTYVQHFSVAKEIGGSGCGDKYAVNDQYQGFYYRYVYPNSILTIQEIINACKDPKVAASSVNKLAAARIWKVLLMQRITDLYGDVPYSDAAKAREGNFLPKYDAQGDIYADLLKELDEAIKSFDPAQPTFGSADYFFNGDINRWKKFGYSLMLRVAMRCTKVTDGKVVVKDWVQKAVNGGVILAATDNAVINYASGPQTYNQNPVALELIGQDYTTASKGANNIEWSKFSKTFIDFLQTNQDPRLPVLSVVWTSGVPDTTAANQKGMANGTDNKPANFVTFSEPNPNTILKFAAPLLILTNAETNFLMSEAAARGWISGNAAQYYKDGVTAAMRNLALFGAGGMIPQNSIDAYLTAHPFNAGGTFDQQMQQIHSQFWVAMLLDEQEAYANWRRTGYPALTPVNYPSNATNGTIPRRLPYSAAEQLINAANYKAAVTRQGADLLTTRIWWDK